MPAINSDGKTQVHSNSRNAGTDTSTSRSDDHGTTGGVGGRRQESGQRRERLKSEYRPEKRDHEQEGLERREVYLPSGEQGRGPIELWLRHDVVPVPSALQPQVRITEPVERVASSASDQKLEKHRQHRGVGHKHRPVDGPAEGPEPTSPSPLLRQISQVAGTRRTSKDVRA